MIRKETQVGRAVAILALLLSMHGVGFGEDATSLAGIGPVYVLVEYLPDGAKAIGLTREILQTDVELRLRKAGIQVTSIPVTFRYLYVVVNVLVPADGFRVVYSVDVEYRQSVAIPRLNQEVMASTWASGGLGTDGISTKTQGVRGLVGDLVDRFINAYLSVNPK